MITYQLREVVPEDIQKELGDYPPMVAQLLFNRGILTKETAKAFLTPDFTLRHDPFLMTDMEKAVERILVAMKEGERMAVWSDYDCDGIPGAVLFHDFFKAVGYLNFENYIPHRHDEGFGLNTKGIDALASRGVTLMITLDCGSTNVDEVIHARTNGIETIITDHHEPSATLPPAFAILNPKRDDAYPFRELCGTGVAWKLIEGLIARGSFTLKDGEEKWWLDMVGLATMADMVSLTGENRLFAHFGMTVMRKTKRKGLNEMFRALKLDPKTLSDDDIGFSIAPRVNAASRMGKPHDAFHVFTTTDGVEARTGAAHLERINNERKGAVAAMVKDLKKRLVLRDTESVIVIGSPEWRPSLLGLAANSLAEEYQRPVFVWGRDGRNILKGSCRSDGVVSVVALMEHAKDSFIEFGGHHAAGGFAVHEEKIHSLGESLNNAYEKSGGTIRVTQIVSIDANLTIDEVTDSFYRSVVALSPFGVGNTKPIFRFCGITASSVTAFGKTKEHTKIIFEGTRSTIEAISFFKTPDRFTDKLTSHTAVDVIAHVEKSYFMNRPLVRLRIIDVL